MTRINWRRVLIGGIVAGIVINISEYILNDVVLRQEWQTMMAAVETGEVRQPSVVVWVVYSLLLGITAIWVYAAIRPRFRPGPGTALKAALAVWILAYLLWSIAVLNLGFLPSRMVLTSLAWGLGEAIVATFLGAALYKEA